MLQSLASRTVWCSWVTKDEDILNVPSRIQWLPPGDRDDSDPWQNAPTQFNALVSKLLGTSYQVPQNWRLVFDALHQPVDASRLGNVAYCSPWLRPLIAVATILQTRVGDAGISQTRQELLVRLIRLLEQYVLPICVAQEVFTMTHHMIQDCLDGPKKGVVIGVASQDLVTALRMNLDYQRLQPSDQITPFDASLPIFPSAVALVHQIFQARIITASVNAFEYMLEQFTHAYATVFHHASRQPLQDMMHIWVETMIYMNDSSLATAVSHLEGLVMATWEVINSFEVGKSMTAPNVPLFDGVASYLLTLPRDFAQSGNSERLQSLGSVFADTFKNVRDLFKGSEQQWEEHIAPLLDQSAHVQNMTSSDITALSDELFARTEVIINQFVYDEFFASTDEEAHNRIVAHFEPNVEGVTSLKEPIDALWPPNGNELAVDVALIRSVRDVNLWAERAKDLELVANPPLLHDLIVSSLAYWHGRLQELRVICKSKTLNVDLAIAGEIWDRRFPESKQRIRSAYVWIYYTQWLCLFLADEFCRQGLQRDAKQVTHLTNAVATLTAQKEALQKNLDELEQERVKMVGDSRSVDQIQSTLNEKLHEIQSITQRAVDAEQRAAKAESDLDQAYTEWQEGIKKRTAINAETLASKQRMVDAAQKEVARLRLFIASHDNVMEKSSTMIQEQTSQLEQADIRFTRLQQEMNVLQDARRVLFESEKATKLLLDKTMNESKDLGDRLVQVEGELADVRQQLDETRLVQSQTETNLRTCEDDRARLQDELARLQALQTNQLAQINALNDQYNESLGVINRLSQERNGLIQGQLKQVGELESAITQERTQANQYLQHISQLHSHRDATMKQLEATKSLLADVVDEKARLQRENASLLTQTNRLQQTLAVIAQEREEAAKQHDQNLLQIQSLREDIERHVQQIGEKDGKLEASAHQIADLTEAVQKQKEEADGLRQEKGQLESHINALKISLAQLENDKAQMQQEYTLEKANMEATMSVLKKALDEEKAAMINQLQALQQEHNNLIARVQSLEEALKKTRAERDQALLKVQELDPQGLLTKEHTKRDESLRQQVKSLKSQPARGANGMRDPSSSSKPFRLSMTSPWGLVSGNRQAYDFIQTQLTSALRPLMKVTL